LPRSVRDARLDTRAARLKLGQQKEPHWRQISPGCHLGYYKGDAAGTWIARWRPLGHAGGYRKKRLAAADDIRDANGLDVLSFAQAQEKARAWFDRIVREASALEGGERPHTVADAIAAYLDWYRREKGRATKQLESVVNLHILPELGTILIERLTANRILDWRDALADAAPRDRAGRPSKNRGGLEPDDAKRARRATANRTLAVLKAALHRAHEAHGVGSPAEWKRAKQFKAAGAARLRWLTEDEARRLLNSSEADFRRLVRAALESGCRYGELINLRVSDFVPEGPSLFIRMSKSGKARHVPLDGRAAAFFNSICTGCDPSETMLLRNDGEPWVPGMQQRRMELACAHARIAPAVSFHILRHTYASHRIMKGAPLLVIAHALGHRDTSMVERHYGHLCPGFVRQTIEATGMDLGQENTVITPLRRSG
jgi:integrase